MVKIESKKVEIKRNVEFVYEYLADFTHFSMVANDKIENFAKFSPFFSVVKRYNGINLVVLDYLCRIL